MNEDKRFLGRGAKIACAGTYAWELASADGAEQERLRSIDIDTSALREKIPRVEVLGGAEIACAGTDARRLDELTKKIMALYKDHGNGDSDCGDERRQEHNR